MSVDADGGDPREASLVSFTFVSPAEVRADEHRVIDQPPADKETLLL
jgi:hypothetical protein